MKTATENDIRRIIDKIGHDAYRNISSNSIELVLFGSFNTIFENKYSDLDLLIVGKIKTPIIRGVDFVQRNEHRIMRPSWLGSELANHIAAYGRWIKGEGHWTDKTFVSDFSIKRKKTTIIKNLVYQDIHFEGEISENILKKIKLDLLRLSFLMKHKAFPCSGSLLKMDDAEVKEMVKTLQADKRFGDALSFYCQRLRTDLGWC